MVEGNGRVAYLVSAVSFVAVAKAAIPRSYVDSISSRAMAVVSFYTEIIIREVHGGQLNDIFTDVELYVASLTSTKGSTARRLQLSKGKKAAAMSFGPANGETLEDEFEGVHFWWSFTTIDKEGNRSPWSNGVGTEEQRSYTLTFHKKYRHTVLPRYLEHVSKNAGVLQHQNQGRKLFTNAKSGDSWLDNRKPWRSVPFKHASTFESMALDPELKTKIMEDLDAFMKGDEFYQRVGRAWKRGYLLHGPPGTGKSSLIAAMANYTGYDVYDMELTDVGSNAELRNMLMHVKNKSIIVIEDIDCSIELTNRVKADEGEDEEDKNKEKKKSSEEDESKKGSAAPKVTLSGLLNFTDGLWSCCGDERIIIFTTNFIDKIDAALLRPGRMDMHIHMSYCSFEAFKALAWTHLRLGTHELFEEIEELFGDKSIQMTPADVAEVLVVTRGVAPEVALRSLIKAMLDKRKSA